MDHRGTEPYAPAPVYLPRPVRFPLSTGVTPVELASGVAFFGFLGGAPIFFGSLLPDWTLYVVGPLAGLWGLTLLFTPFQVWTKRASDLEISAEGVRVIGGRHHGARVAWPAMAAPWCFLDEEPGAVPKTTLRLPGGVTYESENAEERGSLRALAGSLRALAEERVSPRPAPRPVVGGPAIVTCASCGAPAIPSERDADPCGHCGAAVAMPGEVRREVRATSSLAAARASSTGALRELLRWRGARLVNLILVAALPPLAIAWPVSASFFDEYYQYHDVFRWTHGALLFVFALALSTGLVLAANALVVSRRAVGLVFATFQARPPESAGEPYGCHGCGAPLAREAESPLARCVYCKSDNVVGIDLPTYAAPELRQAQGLDELVLARRAERRRWTRLSVLALVALLGSGAILRNVVLYIRAHPAERHAPRPPT